MSKNFEKHFHSEHRVLLIKSQPCILAGRGCRGGIDNAHVVSRGRGGTYKDIVPLCRKHHMELDQALGKRRFEEKYNLSLDLLAKETHLKMERIMQEF